MKGYCPPRGQKEERLLFIRHSALGDVVRAVPIVATIKETFPALHITWLLERPLDELIKGQPYVDDVLVWDRKLGFKGFVRLILKIRKASFTHMISMQGTDRSAVIAFFSGIKNRAGRHDWASFVYNMPSEDLTEVLGRPVKVEKDRVYYQVSSELCRFADDILSATSRPRVACIIGASKPVKRWPACSWAEFVSMVASSDGSAVLLGHGRQETDMAKEIISLLPEEFKEKTVDLVGKLKLDEMAAVIEACDLVIGGDTGPMHLALALHKPSVGLFGPTLPGQVGLDKINIRLLSDCKCAGCQNWDCDKNCLSSIKPKEAFEALAKLHEFSRNQMIK